MGNVDVRDSIAHRQRNIREPAGMLFTDQPAPGRSGIARVNLCTLSVQIRQVGTHWHCQSLSHVMVALIYLLFN
jgi:hypothetical protein